MRQLFVYVSSRNMANIDDRELAGFRELAKHYADLSDEKITTMIKNKGLVEICIGIRDKIK
ncbi:type II toxin-antitoxin system RelE/ParE family toxin [Photorhabdus khanii]|uniref:type II toxin-antitoxin system RelE/ParE family toxin n=1 Tax=Photorhabdus khanii TaxID=1004150 RepID=UPI0039C03515